MLAKIWKPTDYHWTSDVPSNWVLDESPTFLNLEIVNKQKKLFFEIFVLTHAVSSRKEQNKNANSNSPVLALIITLEKNEHS